MNNKPDYSNFNARQKGEYKDIWQSTGKCVFCDLRDKYILYEENGVVLTMNLFPYTDGHLMIIPRRHSESVDQVTPKEWDTIYKIVRIGSDLLKKEMKIDDIWVLYRIGDGYKAGKSVIHSHVHLIPYSKNLLQINYAELSVAPVELAERLRKGLKNGS